MQARTKAKASKRISNQQNKYYDYPCSTLENADKLSGWDDDKTLLQQNPNVQGAQISRRHESKQSKLLNIRQSISQKREQHKRKKASKIQSSNSNFNAKQLQPIFQECFENSQLMEIAKCQMSNIQFLKIQAKHLQNDQLGNIKLPIFTQNKNIGYDSQVLNSELSYQNKNIQLQTSQFYPIGRKVRTQSTKRKKKQLTISQNDVGFCQNRSSTSTNAAVKYNQNNKFYRTLTNEWITSLNRRNPHLIIQSYGASQQQLNVDQYKQHQQYKNERKQKCSMVSINCASNVAKVHDLQQSHQVIHYKKYRPFTKYFQCKRKNKNAQKLRSTDDQKTTSIKQSNNELGCANFIKKIEGRKLYQLLTLNRQMIKIQHA